MLFEAAVEMYWTDKSKRLRGNTLEGYASAIRRHLMPAWEGREIEERIGRGYDQGRDRIISINGDPDACSSAVTGVKVVGSNVRCYVSPKPDVPMRIDTLIVAG